MDGVELPKGAVLADLSQQAPNNSYSPPLYYVDRPFTCEDCGREEVWTASQQKWYYEVAKGPIYATAVRCAESTTSGRQPPAAGVGCVTRIANCAGMNLAIRECSPMLAASATGEKC
jgi:hypothetical protein